MLPILQAQESATLSRTKLSRTNRPKQKRAERKTPRLRAPMIAGLFAGYLALALVLYHGVLDAGFISDDWQVIVHNPYVQELSLENLVAMFDPFGPSILYAMNYSPVHLLVHAVQIELFGVSTTVFHVTNLLLHAATGVLLALLFVSSRLPLAVAALAGALFVVHPANTETVALIFQTKTLLSTALGLGAILLHWRHPAWASLAFTAALLTKLSAIFALPVVVLWSFTRRNEPDRVVPPVWWLAVWAAALTLVAIPELAAFQRTGEYVPTLGADAVELGRSIVAIAGRYLWMAVTSLGVSAYHQIPASASWADPWFLAGALGLAFLGWRSIRALRRGDEEVGYWALAFASFLPICQIFPFVYPMADRYLYAILPGLLGGALLAGREGVERFWSGTDGSSNAAAGRPRWREPRAIGLALGVILCCGFAVRSAERAPIFENESSLQIEAERNYPDGIAAWMRRGSEAARLNDVEGVAEAMSKLRARGFLSPGPLLANPDIARLSGHPKIRAIVRTMALDQIERLSALEDPHQVELFLLADAHLQRRERDLARAALERALEVGGPQDDAIRQALRSLDQR